MRGARFAIGRARRLHVEKHMFDVARLVEMLEAIGEALDLSFRKNEAMIGRLPGNFVLFVERLEAAFRRRVPGFRPSFQGKPDRSRTATRIPDVPACS
jgi:hypothetical protein